MRASPLLPGQAPGRCQLAERVSATVAAQVTASARPLRAEERRTDVFSPLLRCTKKQYTNVYGMPIIIPKTIYSIYRSLLAQTPGVLGDRATRGRLGASVCTGWCRQGTGPPGPALGAVLLETGFLATFDGAMAVSKLMRDIDGPPGHQIRALVESISAPTWTLRLDDKVCIAGVVTAISGDTLSAGLFQFLPHRGFVDAADLRTNYDVVIPRMTERPANLFVGAHVICVGCITSSSSSKIVFTETVAVGIRPEFISDMTWSALHLFSGSFSGWTQAAKWISNNVTGVAIGQEIELDAAVEVANAWIADGEGQVLTCPLSPFGAWMPAAKIRVLGQVKDLSVLNLCQHQVNLMVTLSPPCQSWSKGGRLTGLHSLNGIAFVDGLVLAFCSQAILILAECVDELNSHQHFPVIKFIASALGYKMAWTQIASLHKISPHSRNRWLCCWVRTDVKSVPLDVTLPLSICPKPGWTDDAYRFVLPRSWQNQILLSDTEKQKYGAVHLLPPAKRKQFEGRTPSPTEVLASRIPSETDPLPTLCASYSTQHALAEHHLDARGIFAALQLTPGGYAFFDPAMFIALLGGCDDLTLPTKLGEAFRLIGNAIAVPHAALALLVGLQTVLPVRLDILGLVRSCWLERLTAFNSVLFQQGDWIHIVRHSNVANYIKYNNQPSLDGNLQCTVYFHNEATTACGSHKSEQSWGQCLRSILQAPPELLWHFKLKHLDATYVQATSLRELLHTSLRWELLCDDTQVGVFVIESQGQATLMPKRIKTEDMQIAPISPTLPFVPLADSQQTPCVVLQQPASEVLLALHQAGVLRLLDNTCERLPTAHTNFTILEPTQGLSFSCWIPTADHDKVVHQLRIETKHELCVYRQFSMTSLHSVIIFWHPDRQDTRCVILQAPEPAPLWSCVLPMTIPRDQKFDLQGSIYQIQHINTRTLSPPDCSIANGDILHLTPSLCIAAGGHHLTGAPSFLQADATFSQRAEFATNTHGWLAADEMAFICQHLQWALADGPRYSPPVYWDSTTAEFQESPFGPPSVWPSATTHMPVLVDNHWCAMEITRQGDDVQVTTVQVPRHLHTRIILIVARLMDVGPHRMQITHEHNHHIPHLCGWQLIHRWATALGLADTIASIDNQLPANQDLTEQITIVLQSAIEDWHDAGAPPPLWSMAALLCGVGQTPGKDWIHSAESIGYSLPTGFPGQDCSRTLCVPGRPPNSHCRQDSKPHSSA